MKSRETTQARQLKTLEQTAYHEAGHAVMATWLRCNFRHVSIISDDSESSLGHILSGKRARLEYNRVDPTQPDRYRAEKYILVSFAGNAVERLFTGQKTWKGSKKDLIDAYDYMSCLIQEDDEVTAYFKWLQVRARNILSLSWNWFAVETLAKALLKEKYIGSRLVRQIIKNAWKDSVNHLK
jgi:hypothetical protein